MTSAGEFFCSSLVSIPGPRVIPVTSADRPLSLPSELAFWEEGVIVRNASHKEVEYLDSTLFFKCTISLKCDRRELKGKRTRTFCCCFF